MSRSPGRALLVAGWVLLIPSLNPVPTRAQSSPEPDLVARELRAFPAEVATLMVTGREGGSLRAAGLSLLVGDPLREPVVVVEIDGKSLLGSQPPAELEVDVFAYVVNDRQEVKGFFGQTFPLTVRRWQERLFAGGVKFVGRLGALPPDRYTVRLLVRERRTQRFAFRLLDLSVPGANGPVETMASPLLFPDTGGSWLLAHVRDPEGVLRGGLEGLGWPLAVLPVLAPGSSSFSWLPSAVTSERRRLGTVRFLDVTAQPVAEVDLVPLGPAGEGEAAGSRQRVRIEVPELAPGVYQLELGGGGREPSEGEEEDGDRTRGLRQPVLVALTEGEDPVAWTELSMAALLPERGQSTTLEISGGSRQVALAVARRYRELLELLADGERDQALLAAYELEGEVLETVEQDPRLVLARGEMAIVQRLAKSEAESLVPVMLLHLDLHRRYVGERNFEAASHTADLVIALAEIYAEEAATDMAPVLSAEVLASIGAYLQSAYLRAPGRRMLERALQLDPRSPYALLQIAVGHESYGEYDEVVRYLSRLLEARPESTEGRLRMAVSLRRQGEVGEASRMLSGLLSEEMSTWQLAIAYQELARIHLAAGRPERAARVLQEGARRLPDLMRLRLQLAYALDRAGEGERAAEVIEQAGGMSARAGSSPRFLYNRRLGSDPDDRREDLLRGAMARLPALGVGLESIPEIRGRV